MNEVEKEQLRVEIEHIFDSGANEIRIFEMVKSFIESRNGINKLPLDSDFCACEGVQDLHAMTGECRKCGKECTY